MHWLISATAFSLKAKYTNPGCAINLHYPRHPRDPRWYTVPYFQVFKCSLRHASPWGGKERRDFRFIIHSSPIYEHSCSHRRMQRRPLCSLCACRDGLSNAVAPTPPIPTPHESAWPRLHPEARAVREMMKWQKRKGGEWGTQASQVHSYQEKWESKPPDSFYTAISLFRGSHPMPAGREARRGDVNAAAAFSLNFYAALLPSKVMHGSPRADFPAVTASNSNPRAPEEETKEWLWSRRQEQEATEKLWSWGLVSPHP